MTALPQTLDVNKRKVQMLDIAKLAGVSTATVSRALNGSESIRPETRERILALAQAHQYTVHAGAAQRTLRAGTPTDRKSVV